MMTLKLSFACVLILAVMPPAARAQPTTPAQLQKTRFAADGQLGPALRRRRIKDVQQTRAAWDD